MKFNTQILLVAMLPFLLSSCATMLNGKFQKVTLETPAKDAKVYVNDELVGEGKTLETKLQRDVKAKQIRIEREGYKPEYTVVCQEKKSPLFIMSVVPFGVLIYPMMYDLGAKSFNYHKENKLSGGTKLVKKEDGQKFVFLEKAAFDIEKDKFVVKVGTESSYNKGKKPATSITNEKDIKIDNTVFSDGITKALLTCGFLDTTNTILKNQLNTLYLNAKINEVVLNQLHPRSGNWASSPIYYYLISEIAVDWNLTDSYGKTLYQTKMKSKSGKFSLGTYEVEECINLSVEDAIASSLLELLDKSEIKKFLAQEKAGTLKLESIAINKHENYSKSIEEATKATATVLTEEGHGSGFFISNDGYLLTNYHVIAGKKTLNVSMNNEQKYPATLIRQNEYADLALLKIDAPVEFAFQLPSEKMYAMGEEVFAIGTPRSIELGQTLSKGIISGIRRVDSGEWIQTDVSVNFGNSGGPLINSKGQLLGIVNSKVVGFGVEGLGFCTPAKDISGLLSIKY